MPPISSILELSFVAVVLTILVGPLPTQTHAWKPHLINFRSPNLYPEGLAYDPSAQHFIVGSLHHRTILSVSDAGVVDTLISDPTLPENVTFLGLAVDSVHNRLLAAIQATDPLPYFSALAAYDLRTRQRLFLTLLPSDTDDVARQIANDVAVDFKGNAYVTNSAGNFIWKVNVNGEASIFSKSQAFTEHHVDHELPYSFCGLNGIVYVSKGYLLVVSHKNLWFLKSQDSWGEAVVYDRVELDIERFATSVAVGGEARAYVLYGHVIEGTMGNVGRDMFGIVEVRSERESKEENVWIFVLIGLGFAYFLFWRFQMRHLVGNLNKKTN